MQFHGKNSNFPQKLCESNRVAPLCSRFFQNGKIRFENYENSYVPKFIVLHNGGFKMIVFHWIHGNFLKLKEFLRENTLLKSHFIVKI